MTEADSKLKPEGMGGFRDNKRDPLALRMLAQGDEFELETILVGGRPREVFKGLPRNLAQLYRSGMQYTDRTGVIDGDTRITFGELFSRAAALASHLSRAYGVSKGDVIALVTVNRLEWIVAHLAITSLGAITASINSRGVAEEMLRAMDLVECRLAIVQSDKDATICAERPDPSWPRIVIDQPVVPLREGQDALFAELAEPQPGLAFEPVDMPQEAGGVILFTSGTTGFPKGALLSQGAICQAISQACFMGRLQDIRYGEESGRTLPPEDRCMSTPAIILGPMFHLGGITSTIRAIYLGTPIVLPGKWNPDVALDLIENIGMTRLSFVPAMVFDMFKSPRATPQLLSRITNMANGAAPLDLDIVRQIKERMPNTLISNTFGQTECPWATAISGNIYLEHPSSCGWPVPCVDVQLRREDGSEAAIGEPGELWLRGAGLMEGYYNNPEATAETIVDGWLATGDIATVDENGIYTIVDRKKSMVISGGENIYCAEVERAVAGHPAVREAFVYGLADSRLGEIVAVDCVVDHGADVDADIIKAHVKAHLAIYKVPRVVNFHHEALPRTASGKVDRGLLLKLIRGDAR